MGEWFSFLIKWAMVPLATLAVFEGTRRVSLRRTAWKHAALLIFGVAVLGGMAGTLSRGASAIDSALALVFDQRPLPPVPGATLAQMTPQEREEKTRLLARIAFEKAGTLATYISASGQPIRYAPSEQEIREREIFRESVARTRTILEFIRIQVWTLMIAAVVAAVAGVYARFYGRSRHKDCSK
jgi:hypothetical protein